MTARCVECGKFFDSHDGGVVYLNETYCDLCSEKTGVIDELNALAADADREMGIDEGLEDVGCK